MSERLLNAEAVETTLEVFMAITDQDRLDIITALKRHFCLECGRYAPNGCHCQNDE